MNPYRKSKMTQDFSKLEVVFAWSSEKRSLQVKILKYILSTYKYKSDRVRILGEVPFWVYIKKGCLHIVSGYYISLDINDKVLLELVSFKEMIKLVKDVLQYK